MADEIDPSPYVRPPVIDVASGVALGVALLSAVPKGANAAVKSSARKLRTSVLAVQEEWGKSKLAARPADKRGADTSTDNAWRCLHDRMQAYAWLPATEYPLAARAAELMDSVFGDGLTFLTKPYATEWAESETLLKRIDKEELRADIDKLAGTPFLAEVRRAHEAYGVALGITKAEAEAPDVRLAEPLRALARAISDHSLQLAAMASADAGSVAAVRAALRPIDVHRAGASARRPGADKADAPATPPALPPASPNTPVPDVPA